MTTISLTQKEYLQAVKDCEILGIDPSQAYEVAEFIQEVRQTMK